MPETVALHIDRIDKSYVSNKRTEQVLRQVSFAVEEGEIVTLLGQSGCGKSTLLNIIGGFVKADEGQVLLDNQIVHKPSRDCLMLFQNYGLLPWRTVIKNVEFGLEQLDLSRSERRERAQSYLKLVGLEERAYHFPHQLSGGMQQRVAIARALAIRPKVILMDEPFGALDTFTRYYLQNELLRIQEQEKTTIVLVTHDIDEAVYLSDRIMMMRANPGMIHKEIAVPLAKPRDRGSSDFQYFRKLILEQFEIDRPVVEEYTI